MKTVSAAEANRRFSHVLREVKEGEIFVVVSRGKPVAIIGPAEKADAQRYAAKEALLARLRRQRATGIRTWTRDELYED
ncbi:type II toxin-antitoxin system Phd/YefM family antitoxin [Nitrosococcus wardiae]|uniref:Antitoxin n=1 Tax=Nitrosococcus wardiae TaxID=1814290 RepID=A0A4P7C4S7_9GAMM|nr:type II toxin-antitoxin system prevent-host-death family antitoxin [Nitrosococcus wardiae]QBQ55956.1 type II toxin-antitoxin system prevent-host-death family antitoxin [Nitrosococcus wardiae]